MTGNSGLLGVIVPMLHPRQVNHGETFLVGYAGVALAGRTEGVARDDGAREGGLKL